MQLKLEDKVAIVTESGRGIGRAKELIEQNVLGDLLFLEVTSTLLPSSKYHMDGSGSLKVNLKAIKHRKSKSILCAD